MAYPEPEVKEQRKKETVAPCLPTPMPEHFFSFSHIKVAASVSLIYLFVSWQLLGFKIDQLVLVTLFNTLYFINATTRRFITGFSIFIIYWIVFDYMKAFPNFRYNTVHVASLYHLEKQLFGISWNGGLVTPNEFFAAHATPFLNIITGFFYLCWVPVPLLFAAYLFFKNKVSFLHFALTFLLVNFIGFVVYYIYPAAPPWYVAQNGFHFIAATPGNTAGLARFDDFFGVRIFAGIYSKSSNVFAAMPSLHAAYMLIVLFYSVKSKMRLGSVVFAVIMFGIWFSAVYNSHHYVLDILAGIGCAVLGIALFQLWILRSGPGKKLMQWLLRLTQKPAIRLGTCTK